MTRLRGFAFEDTIDGYFPLQTSLDQMMKRQRLHEAYIEVLHLPIMHIPGLDLTAPVPLNVRAGRVGMIDTMVLWIREGGSVLSGSGAWRWFGPGHQEETFDPMTRLAEPAFVQGISFEPLRAKRELDVSLITVDEAEGASLPGTLDHEGCSTAQRWGPFPSQHGRILRSKPATDTEENTKPNSLRAGRYILSNKPFFPRDKSGVGP